MSENIKINVNILPFGQVRFLFNSSEEKLKEEEMPTYIEPQFTSIEKMEISYEGSKEYKIPKTTDGK